MGIILKLLHGSDTLDLNAGRYSVGQGFRPPTTERDVTYGNVMVGAIATEKRRKNISWNIPIHITGAASIAENERALRNLQRFLNNAGDEAETLYIAYRAWDSPSAEPYFGQFGAYARYEIVHATAQASSQYGTMFAKNAGKTPNASINLVIKPQAVGLEQFTGQAIGGMFEDSLGAVSGSPRGTIIPPATTNLFTNPIFGNATYSTNWTLTQGSGASRVSENLMDFKYICFGRKSARLEIVAPAADMTFGESLTLTVATYTLSCYVKREDGGALTTSEIKLWQAADVTTTLESVGDGWYRASGSFTGAASAKIIGLVLFADPGSPIYVDGFQVELKSDITPLCHGNLLGCTWSSTAHASSSSRTAGRLRYAWADIYKSLSHHTTRIVWMPDKASTSANRFLLEADDNDLRFYVASDDTVVFQVETGATATSAAQTFAAGTPVCFHLTYDGTNLALYKNGVSIATGTDEAPVTAPTWVYVGTNDASGLHAGGTILDVTTWSTELSATDVTADYGHVKQIMDDKERVGPLPWRYTEDGDDIVDNENDGSDLNYAVVGGLMGDDIDTALKVQSSTDWITADGLMGGTLPVDQRLINTDFLTTVAAPSNTLLFIDEDDSTVDATANNGVRNDVTVTTTAQALAETQWVTSAYLVGRGLEVYGLIVLKGSGGGTFLVRLGYSLGAQGYYSPWKTLAQSASVFKNFIVGPLFIPDSPDILDLERLLGFKIELKRSASSGAGEISHGLYMFNHWSLNTEDVAAGSVTQSVYIRGREAWTVDADANATQGRARLPLMTRPIYLEGGKLNIWNIAGGAEATIYRVDDSFTIKQWSVTPRWDIY